MGFDHIDAVSRPEYPEDVPENIEEEIEQVVAGDEGIEIFHRNREKQIKFASVVYWALESNYDDISDRRKAAQETAVDVFDWSGCENPQAYVLNICGVQAFEGVEYQRKQLYVQNKWQVLFERLVKAIEYEEE